MKLRIKKKEKKVRVEIKPCGINRTVVPKEFLEKFPHWEKPNNKIVVV